MNTLMSELDEREKHANADMVESSLMAVLNAKSKLKKLGKKNRKRPLKTKRKEHPWDKPNNHRRLLTRRASILGSILLESEEPIFNMSYKTRLRRYRFMNKKHTSEAEENELRRNQIVELDTMGKSLNSKINSDVMSFSSGLMSAGSDGESRYPGFPTTIAEKRKVMALHGCSELHFTPRRDLYSILRDRYDPDHCESPMDPLYSFEALCKRESLLFHPDVRSTLTEIWRISDSDKSGSISYKEYEAMHECMSIAVYGPNYLKKSEKIRKRLCMQDWNLDRQGEDELDYSRFTMCWFQLADQFTDKIRAADYVKYLRDMFFKMVEQDNAGRPKWKKLNVIAGLEKSDKKSYKLLAGKEEKEEERVQKKATEAKKQQPARPASPGTNVGFGSGLNNASERTIDKLEQIKKLMEEKRRRELEGDDANMTAEEKKKRDERDSMIAEELKQIVMQADLSSVLEEGAFEGVLDSSEGYNMFDDIMNKFVDRNAFSRQAKFSGGHDGNRRKSSIFREGHLGMDTTEYEKIKMRIETYGKEEKVVEKEEETDSDEYEDKFDVYSDDITREAVVEKAVVEEAVVEEAVVEEAVVEEAVVEEAVVEEAVVEEKSIESMTSTERRTERKRELTVQDEMFKEEIRTKEAREEERRLEIKKEEEKQLQIREEQQKVYKEAIEKKKKVLAEKAKKKQEAEAKFAKKQEEMLENAVEAEKKAYERRERKRLEKKRRNRPMKGHLMVFGKECDTGPDRPPHHRTDGYEDLMLRMRPEVEGGWVEGGEGSGGEKKLDWMDNKRKVTMNTVKQNVINNLMAKKKERQMKKQILVLTTDNEDEALKSKSWFKGDSHLCWSSGDGSCLPKSSEGYKTLNDLTWNFGGSGSGTPGAMSGSNTKTRIARSESRGFFAGRPVTPTILHSAGRKPPHILETDSYEMGSSSDEELRSSRPQTAPARVKVEPISKNQESQHDTILIHGDTEITQKAVEQTMTTTNRLKVATVLNPFETGTFKDFEKITPKTNLGLLPTKKSGKKQRTKSCGTVRRKRDTLFSSQQLSDMTCWSPQMVKQINRIFSPVKTNAMSRARSAGIARGVRTVGEGFNGGVHSRPSTSGAHGSRGNRIGSRPSTSPGHFQDSSASRSLLKDNEGTLVGGITGMGGSIHSSEVSQMESTGDNSSTFGPIMTAHDKLQDGIENIGDYLGSM